MREPSSGGIGIRLKIAEHDVDEGRELDDVPASPVESRVVADGERDEREQEVRRRPGRGHDGHALLGPPEVAAG